MASIHSRARANTLTQAAHASRAVGLHLLKYEDKYSNSSAFNCHTWLLGNQLHSLEHVWRLP